jgi:hypothetical protein
MIMAGILLLALIGIVCQWVALYDAPTTKTKETKPCRRSSTAEKEASFFSSIS